MNNVVKIVGVSVLTLAILGAPVLLFLSFMLDWPWIISYALILVMIADMLFVWCVVEMLYEEEIDA